MTQKIELLQSRKPGAPGCFLIMKRHGIFSVQIPDSAIPAYVTTFNPIGQIISRKQNCVQNQQYNAGCYITEATSSRKMTVTVTVPSGTNHDDISFLPTNIVDTATILLNPGVYGDDLKMVFKWNVQTLNLNVPNLTKEYVHFKLTTADCTIKTINVQAKVFDSEENAVAFVNSLPDTDPSRTLNLDSTMDAGIKNAMKTAAQAKGWTVNETEMSQAQQSANNITEQQADNDLQKELASVQQELQSDKVINGTTPGGIFGAAEQSAPDLEYVDSTEKEQPQVEQTTVTTPSQEDTQKQA